MPLTAGAPTGEQSPTGMPCEVGDGDADHDDRGLIECHGTGGGFYHLDCHATACSSRVCARENDL